MVSWISFVVPPEVIPGRMVRLDWIRFFTQVLLQALLVTLFLVLVNIFNTVTTNTPKAEGPCLLLSAQPLLAGLTAIEAWMLSCILFVFGCLIGGLLEIRIPELTLMFSEYAIILVRKQSESVHPPPTHVKVKLSSIEYLMIICQNRRQL